MMLDDCQDVNQSFLGAVRQQGSFLDITDQYFEIEDSSDLLEPVIYEHNDEDEDVENSSYSQNEILDFFLEKESSKNRTQGVKTEKNQHEKKEDDSNKFGQSEFFSDGKLKGWKKLQNHLNWMGSTR